MLRNLRREIDNALMDRVFSWLLNILLLLRIASRSSSLEVQRFRMFRTESHSAIASDNPVSLSDLHSDDSLSPTHATDGEKPEETKKDEKERSASRGETIHPDINPCLPGSGTPKLIRNQSKQSSIITIYFDFQF